MKRGITFLGITLAALVGCRESASTEAPAERQTAQEAGELAAYCEHGLTAALCTKCNPHLVAVFKAKGDWCEEHGFAESLCPICHPGAAMPDISGSSTAAPSLETRVVRFRSAGIEKSADIRTAIAQEATASSGVECSARIAFHSDRVADVRAIVPGIVRRVRVELGQHVGKGDVLFELESTRVGEIQGALQTAQQRVRTAKANLARQRELKASDIASARQVELAQQELSSAEAKARTAEATLKMAGAARSAPSGRYQLRTPIAGTVVRRPAVLGLLATESESLATIADTDVMWVLCDVAESDATRVAEGQKLSVVVADTSYEGAVTWVSAEVDPRSRTVTTRAEVANPDGRLRANQFVRARIQTGAPKTAVSVPRSAVQRVGDQEVVFVRTEPGVFETRVVERQGDGDLVQITGRVKVGDAVVTTGAVLLRTEIVPGSIGAGCCEVDVPGGG